MKEDESRTILIKPRKFSGGSFPSSLQGRHYIKAGRKLLISKTWHRMQSYEEEFLFGWLLLSRFVSFLIWICGLCLFASLFLWLLLSGTVMLLVPSHRCGALLDSIINHTAKPMGRGEGWGFKVLSPALNRHCTCKLKDKLQCRALVGALVFPSALCLSADWALLLPWSCWDGTFWAGYVLLLRLFSLNALWCFAWILLECGTEILGCAVITVF